MRNNKPLPRLYALTDTALSGQTSHVGLVRQLLSAGCRWIQVREKSLADGDFYDQLKGSLSLCQQAGAILMVNDRLDLAMATGVHGIHLGQEDLSPSVARKLLGSDSLIGQSTHSLRQALEADRDDSVDYVALGPIFATPTKRSDHTPLGLRGLHEVRLHIRKPLVAIGGIGHQNAGSVLRAGCDSVAVIAALMKAASIGQQTAELLDLLEEE